MRFATSLVSISLLALPLLQLPVNAGLSAERSLIAQKQQVPQRQVTDYFPDDPFWKYLDAENKSVINRHGTFNTLYFLKVYRRKLSRAAEVVGIDLSQHTQPENPVPDDEWFLLMNTSRFLKMLYPEELRELRKYGFNTFKLADARTSLLWNQLKAISFDKEKKHELNQEFAPNNEERIDQMIDQMYVKLYDEYSDEIHLDERTYGDIASLIKTPQDISSKSLSFLVSFSYRLLINDDFERSLDVAKKAYELSMEKWGNEPFLYIHASQRLIQAEQVARAMSVSGRGGFKYRLPIEVLSEIDSQISLIARWWGPNSPKLIPFLSAKADFIEGDAGISGDQRDAQIIALLSQAETIYLDAKKNKLFPADDEEILADQEMSRLAMLFLNADLRRGDYQSAYQRILSFKAYPFHPNAKSKSIQFQALLSNLVSSGRYSQAIEFSERLVASHEINLIELSSDELQQIHETLAEYYVYVGRFEEFDRIYEQLDQGNPALESLQLVSLLNRGIIPEVQYPLPSLVFTEDNFSYEIAGIKHVIAMIGEAAAGNYMKSAEIGEALYSSVASHPSSFDPGDVSKLLSVVYFAMGDKVKGADLLTKTVFHKQEVKGAASMNDQIGINELKLSLVEKSYGQTFDKAESIFNLWLQHLQGELALMPSRERTEYLQSAIASIQDSEALSLLLSDSGVNAKKPELPLYYILNRKGLLEELEKRQRQVLNASPSTQELVQQLRAKEKLVADGQVQGDVLKKLKLEINTLERKLYRDLPRIQPRFFSVQEVSQALPPDGALVEFIRYQWANPVDPINKKEHYAAFVLRPNWRVSLVQLGEVAAIDSNISLAINALEQKWSDSEALLKQAFDPVLTPLIDELSGVRILYLSPDGELNRLPFAAASLGRSSSMLSDQMTVRILTTGRELVQLAERQDADVSSAVVVANPDFDRAGVASRSDASSRPTSLPKDEQSSKLGTQRALGLDQIWSRLDYTQEEGQVAAQLLGGSLLSGEQASTIKVKSIRSPRVAHFATHGYFMPDEERKPRDPFAHGSSLPLKTQPSSEKSNPLLRSGIVMAGANQPDANPADDGYLTALEVLQLDWEGTELVVVSACESGRGLVKRGEGMYGLKRAFAVAGARSSLLSLWKVDDKATAAFMQSFYQRLKDGKGKGDALAETQQEFRNSHIPAWRHPYFWAAFQLSGDWGPVKGL